MRGLTRTAVTALLLTGACNAAPTHPEPDPGGGTPQVATLEAQAVAASVVAMPVEAEVIARDGSGQPVAGQLVQWQILSGGGHLPVDTSRTDAAGRARATWLMGPEPVENRLRAALGTRVTSVALTTTPPLDPVYFGRADYVEYLPGTLPIVVAAPHGGTLTPDELPDRTGNVTTVRDRETEELARQIGEVFDDLFGGRPHIIIMRLRRTKIDANREIVEATLGHPLAERAWHEFHLFTDAAKAQVMAQHGSGFFLDLHGHGHTWEGEPLNWIELGYRLTATELAGTDTQINGAAMVTKSSIRTLVQTSGSTHVALLRGPYSLGTLLEEEGYRSVPAASDPHPDGRPYFSGGYNTMRHGCSGGGPICGVQVEANFAGVRDTPANRAAFAAALGRSLETFFQQHYGVSLGAAEPAAGAGVHTEYAGAPAQGPRRILLTTAESH
jgi:hypothetical protein